MMARVMATAVGVALGGMAVLAQGPARGSAPVSAEHIRGAMKQYVTYLAAGDVDGIMGLYGDNPSVEDPVGAKPIVGRDAVRAFYTRAGALKVELVGAVRVAGLEGAMPMIAQLEMGALKGFIDVIDTMKFDERGKIVSMRAYWNPGDIRPQR